MTTPKILSQLRGETASSILLSSNPTVGMNAVNKSYLDANSGNMNYYSTTTSSSTTTVLIPSASGFIDNGKVLVFVNGILKTQSTDYTFTITNNIITAIVFKSSIASGSIIKVISFSGSNSGISDAQILGGLY